MKSPNDAVGKVGGGACTVTDPSSRKDEHAHDIVNAAEGNIGLTGAFRTAIFHEIMLCILHERCFS